MNAEDAEDAESAESAEEKTRIGISVFSVSSARSALRSFSFLPYNRAQCVEDDAPRAEGMGGCEEMGSCWELPF